MDKIKKPRGLIRFASLNTIEQGGRQKFTPRMAKQYGNAGEVILEGLKSYVSEVTGGEFPQPENYFGMKDDEYEALLDLLR